MAMQATEAETLKKAEAGTDPHVVAERGEAGFDRRDGKAPRNLSLEETKKLHQELERSGSRYRPIFVKGEAVSVTLLRDRGSY